MFLSNIQAHFSLLMHSGKADIGGIIFLRFDKANAGTTREASDEDFRGVCATQGFAYKFETLSDELPDHMLWTTTCKGSKGTLAANTTQVHALFVNQIPDFKPVFTQIY